MNQWRFGETTGTEYKRSMPGVLVAIGLAIASWGCATPHYYAVRSTYATTIPEEHPERPNATARSALGQARVVAFFPPESCNDQRARPSGTALDVEIMRLRCGVLMSELESAASKAGFEVVSWQSLRGADRPITYAKAAKVDILFEINELDTIETADRSIERSAHVFKVDAHGQLRPIEVSADIGRRCLDVVSGTSEQPIPLGASLDVKMVSVNDSRVLWRYRVTRARDLTAHASTLYYSADPRSRFWGWFLVALGVTSLASAGLVEGSEGAIGVGMLSSAIGTLVILTRGHQPLAQVLCKEAPVPDPHAKPAQETKPQPAGAASSFTRTTTMRVIDPLAEYRKKLMETVVREFLKALADETDAARRQPPPPPPPSPPAPQPAPSPPSPPPVAPTP